MTTPLNVLPRRVSWTRASRLSAIFCSAGSSVAVLSRLRRSARRRRRSRRTGSCLSDGSGHDDDGGAAERRTEWSALAVASADAVYGGGVGHVGLAAGCGGGDKIQWITQRKLTVPRAPPPGDPACRAPDAHRSARGGTRQYGRAPSVRVPDRPALPGRHHDLLLATTQVGPGKGEFTARDHTGTDRGKAGAGRGRRCRVLRGGRVARWWLPSASTRIRPTAWTTPRANRVKWLETRRCSRRCGGSRESFRGTARL